MNPIPPHRTENHSEETSLLAYHLWQQAHCPPGQDLQFWLQAEEQLFGKNGREPTAKAIAVRPTAKRATASSVKSQSALTKKPARAR